MDAHHLAPFSSNKRMRRQITTNTSKPRGRRRSCWWWFVRRAPCRAGRCPCGCSARASGGRWRPQRSRTLWRGASCRATGPLRCLSATLAALSSCGGVAQNRIRPQPQRLQLAGALLASSIVIAASYQVQLHL